MSPGLALAYPPMHTFHMRLTTLFVYVFCLGLCGVVDTAAHAQVQLQVPIQQEEIDPLEDARYESEILSDEEFSLPLDTTAAQSADQLIPKLGSPSFKEREEATAGLIEIGAPTFASMARRSTSVSGR